MLKTIEDKMSAIKAINDQKDKIDVVLEKIQGVKPAMLPLTVQDIDVTDLLPNLNEKLLPLIQKGLQTKRQELIDQATKLMK